MKSIVGMLASIVVVAVAHGCALDGKAPWRPGPERAIVDRAAASAKTTEPEWRFTPGICTCGLLMKEEVGVATGLWKRNSHDPSAGHISVTVHAIATVEAASRFMLEHGTGRHLAEGWTLEHSDLGEGAYIALDERTRWYELGFRKGRFIASVGASQRADAERFAKYLIAAISPIG
jgi:hypothetical protein